MSTRLHIESPLIVSDPLSKALGVPVYLKLDNLQPSGKSPLLSFANHHIGSYKIRGLSHMVNKYRQSGKTKLVTSSGGNAGLAGVYLITLHPYTFLLHVYTLVRHYRGV
mgnify:CR=1 FL=1